MRFLHWLSLCLCSALGVVSALGNITFGNSGSCTMRVRNTGGATVLIVPAGGSGSTAYESTYRITPDGSTTPYYVTGTLPDGSSWMYGVPGQCQWAGPLTTNAPAQTNGYSYICIEWENNGTKYADFQWGIMDSNGVFHTASGEMGTPIAPGHGLERCLTNTGFGGEFTWGDARSDTGMDNPEDSGWGIWVSTGTNPGGGNGPGGTGPNLDTNVVVDPRPYEPPVAGGGGTNFLTDQVYNAGVGEIVKGLAGIEDTLRGGLGGVGLDLNMDGVVNAVEANTDSTHADLLNIGNYTTTNGQFLAEISDRIGEGTNGLSGAIGEVADLIGSGTNGIAGLIGTGTNGLSGKLDGLFRGFDTNVIGAMGTNASGVTNGELSGTWSNNIASWIPEVDGINSRADGATAGAVSEGGFLGLNGSAPAADWGVLRGVGFGGVTIFELDAKKALSLEFIEDKISGVRAWVRIIVMWSALFIAVMWYVRELREAVWHTLTPVPLNSPTEFLQLLGGLAVGPVGFGAGTAAGYLMKSASIVAILLGLLWLPAILAVSLGTIFSALGVDIVGDLTNAVSAPQVVQNVFNVTLPWLPAVELAIIALNYAVARLGMDGTVSILMVYIKVGTPE